MEGEVRRWKFLKIFRRIGKIIYGKGHFDPKNVALLITNLGNPSYQNFAYQRQVLPTRLSSYQTVKTSRKLFSNVVVSPPLYH